MNIAKEAMKVPPGVITKMKNGMKVITTERSSSLSSVGVFINAGSRHTANFPQGISQLIKRTAFKGIPSQPSEHELSIFANSLGGETFCEVHRDMSVYFTKYFSENIEEMVSILSDSIFKPVITNEELEIQKNNTLADLEMQEYAAEHDLKFMDYILEAAFRNNTLGLRETPNIDSLREINQEKLLDFFSSYYTFDRMVIAGINVEHQHLVQLTEKYFNQTNPVWPSRTSPIDTSVAQYTGGLSKFHDDKPRKQPGHVVFPEFAYLGIGFEGVKEQSEQVYPLALLYSLLGQGKSFSVGGPGKGLFSRVNTRVLNRHYWVNSCEAHVQAFSDAGFFTIYGTCDPKNTCDFVNVILELYYDILNKPITEEELSRSKNQLLSQLLMNLEHTEYMLEDMGRQTLFGNHYKLWPELCENIQKVSAEDIKQICHQLLKSNPSVAAMGNLSSLPQFEEIKHAVARYEYVKKSRKWSLF